jgi:hypothetical protein
MADIVLRQTICSPDHPLCRPCGAKAILDLEALPLLPLLQLLSTWFVFQ